MVAAKRFHATLGLVLTALVASAVLGGCVPATTRIIGDEDAFPGLADFLEASWTATTPMHVVLVHGMAHGDFNAPDDVAQSRAAHDVSRLVGSLLSAAPAVTEPSCVAHHNGVLRYTFTFENGTLAPPATNAASDEALSGTIHFHEINFASYLAFTENPYTTALSQQEKRQLFDEDLELTASAALGNRYLKRQIVNWGLTDAATYLDRDKRGEITAAMADAIRGIFDPDVLGRIKEADPTGPTTCPTPASAPVDEGDVRVAFITKSLGSKVLFDALARMYVAERDDPASAAVQILVGSQAVYMLANQIPLLELGTELDARHRWDELWSTDLGPAMVPEKLYLVAFSDPNDLLTFRIAPTVDRYRSVRTRMVAVDVATPIAANWLGLFAWPTTAHQEHLSNAAVVDMLVRGRNWPPPE